MDPNENKIKALGIGLGFAVLALVGVDFIVLKGEPVTSGTVNLRAQSEPTVLSISRAGEHHLVEISTRKRVRGETKGQSISWRLVGPEGRLVAEDSEIVSHKKRFFDFFPTQPGDYELHVEETKLIGSSRGTGHVRVTVGDRRVLSRWLRF